MGKNGAKWWKVHRKITEWRKVAKKSRKISQNLTAKGLKALKIHEKGGNRMFLGEFRHSIDAKKRLFIPAKFREELDSVVILRKHLRYIYFC